MKTGWSCLWSIICLSAQIVPAMAATPPAKADKQYTGIVGYCDPKEHTLEAQGALFSKAFTLSPLCTYILPDRSTGAVSDVRPGENVTVHYQNVSGVLVASRVEQHSMRFEGMVDDIDKTKNTVTVYFRELDRTFSIPAKCPILMNNQPVGFTNLTTGSHVLVTYETPDGTATARRIEQTSIVFTGALKALDLTKETLKAQSGFRLQNFKVAGNCAIVIHGRAGHLDDLKPNDRLALSYDVVKGVNLVNRIVPANEATNVTMINEFKVDL